MSGVASGGDPFDPAHGWTDAVDGVGDRGGIDVEQAGVIRPRTLPWGHSMQGRKRMPICAEHPTAT